MQVICLNILRALFKDSKFGEDVALYASDGLKIAIKGFSSNIWAVRIAVLFHSNPAKLVVALDVYVAPVQSKCRFH